ncbi:hypothetical protein [Rhodoferax sp.]|uniref:hypothetical protein n=1 Tax=Rhodoferax sp. TaxID=50421 RepID=UPI002AB8EFD4|nr:hypothetical protein [Rhodoferax sp.]MDZ4208018.1 hypothetical protein [Rhodoferax sp.]
MHNPTTPSGLTSLTNSALMARRAAAIPRGVGQSHHIFVNKAENAEVVVPEIFISSRNWPESMTPTLRSWGSALG